MIDSITDTDTTSTAVSGAGQADKLLTASNSNFRVSPANSKTTVMRALHDDVSVDVANRPRPPQADRPQRIRRKSARLIDCVHARQLKNCCHQAFYAKSPFWMYEVGSHLSSTTSTACNIAVVRTVEMSSHSWKDAEHISKTFAIFK